MAGVRAALSAGVNVNILGQVCDDDLRNELLCVWLWMCVCECWMDGYMYV